jgi:hypothetical protein
MYYSENKWCPCGERRPKTFICAAPNVCPVVVEALPRVSSQSVAPDVNVNIPTRSTEERYAGFVPMTAKRPPAERFSQEDSLVVDYGNAMIPPIPPSAIPPSAERYRAAVAAFYSALGVSEEFYDFDSKPSPGPIPIEANAYASLPADYAENFTPMRQNGLEVNVYGTVSKWR